MAEHAAKAQVDDEVDMWRDTQVRYLGYANEIGEAFRPLLPRLVKPSYAISFAYVLGDTHHKSTTAYAAAPANSAEGAAA